MARNTVFTVVLVMSSALATACATRAQTGAATGAVAGGAVGAAVGETPGLIIGAALGGLVGHEIGRQMDIEDQRRIAYALERNQRTAWVNQETGTAYEVQPEETYLVRGQQCREFRLQAEVGYDTEEVYGTACRQPDGSWELADTAARADPRAYPRQPREYPPDYPRDYPGQYQYR